MLQRATDCCVTTYLMITRCKGGAVMTQIPTVSPLLLMRIYVVIHKHGHIEQELISDMTGVVDRLK
jgi:hypothetical protein